MNIDIQNLLKLAGEATPGPWFWHKEDGRRTNSARVMNNPQTMAFEIDAGKKFGKQIVSVVAWKEPSWVQAQRNARFIAACSPEVIKALCEVVVASRNWLRDGAVGRGSVEHLNALTKALEPFTEE